MARPADTQPGEGHRTPRRQPGLGARALRGHKFIIGLDPDLPRLEEEPGLAILERLDGPVTVVLLKVPASRAHDARHLFRGIAHIYETEAEARRVWRLFGQ